MPFCIRAKKNNQTWCGSELKVTVVQDVPWLHLHPRWATLSCPIAPSWKQESTGKHCHHFSHRVHLDWMVNVLGLEGWRILRQREWAWEMFSWGLKCWITAVDVPAESYWRHTHMCTHRHSHVHTDKPGPSMSAWWTFQSWQHGKREGKGVLYSTAQRTGFLCRSTREHHLPKKVSCSLHNVKTNLEKDSSALCNFPSAVTRCFH